MQWAKRLQNKLPTGSNSDFYFSTTVVKACRTIILNLISFSQLLHYIQEKICSHEAHVVVMAKQLHNSVAQEVDKFAALPLDQFHYSGVERSVINNNPLSALFTHA